eukprot:4599140-Prymnesium_polylepis.1
MQNVTDDLLDGGAEPHDLTDDAGDRVGSLDDDEQCAGGAAIERLRGMHDAAPATVSCLASN